MGLCRNLRYKWKSVTSAKRKQGSLCAGRVICRFRGEEEAESTEFDKVLQELGRRHEQEHLQTLGTVVDLSRVPQEERFTKTQEAIAARTAVIYQPALRLMTVIDGIDCEVVGYETGVYPNSVAINRRVESKQKIGR